MKSSILSYSRKCNVLDDSPRLSPKSRNSRLKHSMDGRPSQQILNKEKNLPTLQSSPPLTQNDPMMCPSYLSSPIETILQSLDDSQCIPFHDVIEAYSVFSLRIRSQLPALLHAKQPLPALAVFKDHTTSIARALKRDIRRVLFDLSNQYQHPYFNESFSMELFISEHDIQHAQDLSTLSHYSLRVLSDVFAIKILYSYFSLSDIQDLLADVLKIALSTTLSTPNPDRTWSLVLWTIQVQNLPLDILSFKKVDIVTALRQALSGERGFHAKLDGLKAVQTLVLRQPELLGSTVSNFLPAILSNLVTDDVDCRRQAANALCGVALTKLNMLDSDFPHETVSQDIHTFLKAQISMSEDSQAEFCLPHFISQAFASRSIREPFWAVIVPACMAVLSDHFLFLRQSFKFCVNSSSPAVIHENKNVRALHSPLWRTLIWAFSRMPVDQTWLRPEDPDLPSEMVGFRCRAFRFLKQDVRSGKGVSLVEALLLPQTDARTVATVASVSRVLLVIEAMLAKPQQSDRQDGVLLLLRLVSAIGSPRGESDSVMENSDSFIGQLCGLFDGTLLDSVNPEAVTGAIHALGCVDITRVRQLSEVEIVQNWDQFVNVWASALEMSLQETDLNLSSELLGIWQALLLVKTDLTQGKSHLTAPSSFASQVAGIVSRFLVDSTAAASVQAARLTIARKLWGVMVNVYSHSWLPAESILAAVLELEFNLNEDIVREAWSRLCADLISIGIPTLLHVLFTRSEKQEGQEVTRQLWTVLARAWQNPGRRAGWDELTSFLVIPFKAWVMSDDELDLWTSTLQSAISLARPSSIQATVVVDRILQRMGPKELEALAFFPKGLCALLPYLDSAESQDIPSRVLAVLNRTLTANYPPRPESLAPCLEILRFTAQIFSGIPVMLLVPLLSVLQGTISSWIGDAKSVMLSTEHELVVQTLYCRTLGLLRNVPPTIATLNAIAPFLCSAFGRQTPSAIGPVTFDEYWRATYHTIEEYKPLYPDCLKACLLGYGDVYGGSIANGLSITSGSQDTRKSTVPDSQPSYHGPNDATFLLQGFASLSLISEQHRSSKPMPLDVVMPRNLLSHSNQSSQDTARRQHKDPRDNKLNTTTQSSPLRKRPSPTPADNSGRKRRKTVSDSGAIQPQASPQGGRISKRNPDHGVRSPSSEPSQSISQNTDGRKRKRLIDWLNVSRNLGHLDRQEVIDTLSCPESPKDPPLDDEYNSYEREMHLDEIQDLFNAEDPKRQPLAGAEKILAPDSDAEGTPKNGRKIFSSPPHMADYHDNSVLQQRQHENQHHVHQSVSSPKQQQQPAYAGESSPPTGNLTRIGVLERACTVLADHPSQIPDADLVRVNGLVAKLQSTLHEQFAKRFASEPADKR